MIIGILIILNNGSGRNNQIFYPSPAPYEYPYYPLPPPPIPFDLPYDAPYSDFPYSPPSENQDPLTPEEDLRSFDSPLDDSFRFEDQSPLTPEEDLRSSDSPFGGLFD
ncbi:MAG TPA: hypothetical protein VJ697_04600 [Nitrososphaeraceae archaeon]|nr:hypothetical protein [Nitrososphaeraceae archaeon]